MRGGGIQRVRIVETSEGFYLATMRQKVAGPYASYAAAQKDAVPLISFPPSMRLPVTPAQFRKQFRMRGSSSRRRRSSPRRSSRRRSLSRRR